MEVQNVEFVSTYLIKLFFSTVVAIQKNSETFIGLYVRELDSFFECHSCQEIHHYPDIRR